MQARELLFFLPCILLEAQIGLAVEGDYLKLFKSAGIIRSNHGLKITADADQLIELYCTAPCGILGWQVNLAGVNQHSVKLCNTIDECSNTTFLDCQDANEEHYLQSHLLVRPRDEDLVVQCVSKLTIGEMLYTEYSRAVSIRINRTTAEQPDDHVEPAFAMISPSATISHLSSSASTSTMLSSSYTSRSSLGVTTSLYPTMPSRSSSIMATPSQRAISMPLCFVNEPQFTFALVGVSGGLLVLTLIGWILAGLLCCKNRNEKNAQKDNFSQYWNALSSKDSTLDRIQPTAQSPAENSQETNLYSTIMPACSHINSYEHSPQLPSRSHNSNTVV